MPVSVLLGYKMDLHSAKKSYVEDSFHSANPSQTVELAKTRLRRFGRGIFYGIQDVGKNDSIGMSIYKVLGTKRFNEWGKGITD